MEDLTQLAGRVRADHVLAHALKVSGWNTTKLGALKGTEPEVIDAVILKIEKDFHPYKVNGTELENLVEAAEEASCAIWARHGGLKDSDLALSSHLAKVERKLADRKKIREVAIGQQVKRKGEAPRVRWPSKATMLKSAAGKDLYQRQLIEEDERGRWLKELDKQIKEASMWASSGGDDRGLLSRRIGKGRRANTLRKHVKTWGHYVRWLIAVYGIKWPELPMHFADYLIARSLEPCGKSVPVAAYKTLVFMEHAAELPPEVRISESDAIKNSLEEVKLQLDSNDPKPRKQATQLLVTVVAALERKVMQRSAPRFVRAFAWYKLVKLWGAMRYHDTTGVDFSSMRLDGFALVANLTRTKTSGPGKRITVLKVIIGTKVYLEESDWLETGWRLWEALSEEAGCEKRDFLLTLPTGGLEQSSRRMATYQAAMGMSQALFRELECPATGGSEHLMEHGVGCTWSEHSERVTMRTWAGAAGVPEPVCKMLGRWTPTVDQSYDRSIAAQIVRAQMHVSQFIRQNYGNVDPFGEEAVLGGIEEKMIAMGYHEEVIKIQREKLESFATLGRPLKRIRWEDGLVLRQQANPRDEEVIDSSSGGEDDKEKVNAAIRGDAGPVLGDYMVSVVGKAKTKTLHRLGECYRQPGVHYQLYENFKSELPKPSEYHKACKVCFPRALKEAESSGEESSETGDDLSSSSSDGL